MKALLEITDSDLELKPKENVNYTTRTAARAVLRKDKYLALLFVSKHNYYKLPGGGVDKSESIKEGLIREVKEEVGCALRIIKKIGEIIEYRSQFGIIQTSHCFLAEALGEGKPEFTEDEIADGFELVWVDFEKAIDLLKQSKPDTYDGKFIVKRDLEFLRQAKEFF